MIWYILSALVLLLVVLVGVTLILRGRDLSHLDGAPITPTEQDPSPSHREVLKKIREMNRAGKCEILEGSDRIFVELKFSQLGH